MTKRYGKGLTLIELLVTMVVLIIVISIAVPNMRSLIKRQDLISKSSLLSSTLAYARNEAVARVANITVCGTANQTSCNGNSDLSSGWLVFFDKNADGAFVAADGDELLKQGGDDGNEVSMRLAASATSIRYTDRGESREVRQVYFCTEGGNTNPSLSKTLTVSVVGSTRLSAGGLCPSS